MQIVQIGYDDQAPIGEIGGLGHTNRPLNQLVPGNMPCTSEAWVGQSFAFV